MSIIFFLLFITLIIAAVGVFFHALMFGIRLGVFLILASLTVTFFGSLMLSGSLVFLLYLLIRLFFALLVVSLIIGIILWIRDELIRNY